jgi:hypothetical protein
VGGLACAIPRQAVLRFQEVPTLPAKVKEFDAQMRELLSITTIAGAIVAETSRGQEVCDILAKTNWTRADRVTLFDVVEDLYE